MHAMRILIVDDHALFRAGMVLLLSRLAAEVDVVEAGSAEEALGLGRADAADFALVLLDLNLNGALGLDRLRDLRQVFPGAAIVILSGVVSREAMLEARAKGAMGYIAKSVSADGMLEALRQVLRGQRHFPLMDPARPPETRLTLRQRQVLELLCKGRPNKEIAQALGMSENTVRTHLMFTFRALGVRTRTEAALAARRLGWF